MRILLESNLLDNTQLAKKVSKSRDIKKLIKSLSKADVEKLTNMLDPADPGENLKQLYQLLTENSSKYTFIYALLDAATSEPSQEGSLDNNIERFKDIVATSLFTDGFDDATNRFLKFVENVPADINHEEAEVIKQLIDKQVITPEEQWIRDPGFYSESDADVLYKLKAALFVSDKSQLRRFMDPDTMDVDKLMYNEDGSLSSAVEIRKKLEDAQTRSGEAAPEIKKSANDGYVYVGASSPKDYTSALDYILKLPKYSAEKNALTALISYKYFQDDLNKVLSNTYSKESEFIRTLSDLLDRSLKLHKSFEIGA